MASIHPKRVFSFYPLEDRILLSADGIDVSDVDVNHDFEYLDQLFQQITDATDGSGDFADSTQLVDSSEPAPVADGESAELETTSAEQRSLEVVILDAGVEDADLLLSDLRDRSGEDTEWLIVRLSGDTDGVEQIADSLSGVTGIDAIHVLSHGDGNGIQLGNARLDRQSIEGYAGALAELSGALASDADLLIYGCDLASNDDGRMLIESLATLIDCDVAASDDATGHQDLGGDWDLEFRIGEVDTQLAFGSLAQRTWFDTLATITVTTTADENDGDTTNITTLQSSSGGTGISLREAIIAANNTAGADTITFNISGTGVHTINLLSALDDITDAVNIDGWTEPDYAGAPVIEINGSLAGGTVHGLVLNTGSDGSTIRGLMVNEFSGRGIYIYSNNNVIEGNYFGTDGISDLGNAHAGVYLDSTASDNLIGGTTTSSGNIIAYNGWDGIRVNGTGTGNAFLGNSIYSNAEQGIDIGTQGVTANDAGDVDTGGNDLQNFAVLSSVGTDGTTVAIAGSLNSTAYTTYRIEFYANATADGTGYGEGQTYLGYTTVFTNDSGNARFVASFDEAVTAGQFISATATEMLVDGDFGSTSEFAANVTAASALIVDTTDDVVDGTTTSVANLLSNKGADGKISLREAIIATNNTAGHDTIFLPDGNYALSIAGSGENAAASGDLDITQSLTLIGASSASTIIDATGLNDRVLEISGTGTTAYLSGITVTGGNISNGGGILANSNTTFTLWDSVITNNTTGTTGGGLYATGTTFLNNVTVSGNSAAVDGGIYNNYEMLITNSTISGNSATGDGGGLNSGGTGTHLILVNTTISGNTAGANGGGLIVQKLATLINVTVSGNNAGTGGGIFKGSGSVTVNLLNTIVAGNTATTNADVSGAVSSSGNNIIGNTTGNSGWVASDQQNVDPLLNVLADNGGATWTMSLQSGSTAINGGTAINAPVIDQRGYARDASIDIGAYEYNATQPNSAPVITSNGGGNTANISVAENTTAVTTVTATDGQGDTLTYSISGGADAAKFTINSSTGELTFLSAPDFESPTDVGGDNVYEVTVQVSDGNGGTDIQAISVTVTDAAITSVSATGSATVNAGNSYTLNLTADEDATAWTINWGDGTIETVVGDPSSVTHAYAAGNAGLTFNILVSATDSAGDYFTNDMIVASAFLTGEGLYSYTAPDGTFSQFFSGTELTNAYAIAVGPDGLLYAAGHGSDNIVRYNPATGALVDTFVAAGSGGLDRAAGLAFGHDGNLYVSSQFTDEILKYDGTTGAFLGTFVSTGSGGVDAPTALMFRGDGYLYVSSYNTDAILRYDATTGAFVDAFVTAASGGLNGPGDFAFGPDGNLYVSGTNSVIKRYDGTTGVYIDNFVSSGSGGLGESIGLEFGPDGNLYVSNFTQDEVLVFDGSTGALIGDYVTTGSGGLDGPTGLAFAPSHQVRVNSLPVISSDGGGATASLNVTENTTAVTTVTSTDVDGDTAVYSISGGADAAKFAINTSTGALTFVSAPDFESPTDVGSDNVYDVTVQVSDGNGGTDSQAISVTVTDVVEATTMPVTSTSDGGLSLNEDGGNDAYLIADDGGAILGGLTALTTEVRFSMDPIANDAYLTSYATVAGSSDTFRTSINMLGEFRIKINGTLVISTAMDYRTLADSEQHTVSVTWDSSGGLWEIFVDGALVDSGSGLQSGASIATGGTLVFGNEQDSVGGGYDTASSLSAKLYDIRIFDSVRTDADVAANYRSTLPFDESGLVANWQFNSLSTDGVVVDTVSGNHLTVQHATGTGFAASSPTLTLAIDENSIDGTVVGTVNGIDAEREALIASLLASDPDLIYSAETGKFYKGFETQVDFATAQSNALSETLNGANGQLVTIRSAAEQDVVAGIVDAFSTDAWLGGTDSTVEGEWRWLDGSQEADQFWSGEDAAGYNIDGAYHNFLADRPDNGGSGQDAVRMYNVAKVWDDADVTTNYNYVVEWDADEVLDGTQAITYAILSQTVAGAFSIDSSTGEITVADGSLLDYETNATHTITVRSTDVDSNTFDEVFTVSLNDLAEANTAPSDLSSGIELNTDGGNDAYLISGTGLSQDLTAMTVEIRFQANDIPFETVLMSFNDATGDEFSIQIDDPSNSLELDFGQGTIQFASAINYRAALIDGEMHSLAVSWDSTHGDWAVYIDGAFIESGTGLSAGAALNTTGGQFVFGQEQDGLNTGYDPLQHFSGTFYDIRIWNEVRSEAEISLNYQSKFDSGSLPSGLVANWQMDGFNGSNEVVDLVSGNNLSIGHASGVGFTTSTPVEDLHVVENAPNGTTVGYVVPSDPDSSTDVVTDGLFTEATPTTDQFGVTGTFGNWTVTSGSVDLFATSSWESQLGGRLVNLDGGSPGSIEQTLTTTAGQQYQIIFSLTGDFSGGEAVKDLRVSAGGQSTDFAITQASNWAWGETNALETRSFTFRADSASTNLSFASLEGATSQYGPYIGDIRVVEIPAAVTTILNNDPTLSYDAATGKFFRYVNSAEQFSSAIASANSSELNGVWGQLITIDSAYENELVRQLADGNDVWLGGTDATTEGDWRWLDGGVEGEQFWSGGTGGTSVGGNYTNWSSGSEPNNSTWLSAAGEDAAAMQSDGTWYDQVDDASLPLGYIIEWDASEVLSNFTFSLTDDAGGRFAIDSSTGEITVADGSLIDYETATSHSVTVEVTDAAGNTFSEAMTIAVDNLGPTQSIPIGQTVNEDEALVFSTANGNAITISDETAADARIQVTLSVSNGTLRTTNFGGYVFVSGTNGSSTFTLEGTESAINAALEGLEYTPNADYNGSDSLIVTTAINADLEGYYTFEGGNADDQSESAAENGALIGDAATVLDPERGEVLDLSGSGTVEINSLFGTPSDVTLATWVNLRSADSSGTHLISLGDSVTLAADLSSGSWGVSGVIYGGSTWNVLSSGLNIAGSGWHHIAFTHDDTNNVQRLYVDGVEVASANFVDSIDYTLGSTTKLGAHGDGSTAYDLDGQLDDARIYNRALSADEIAAIATDEFQVSDTIAITINAVNDTPAVSGPGSAYTVNEQTNLSIEGTGFSVTDVDAAAGTMTATFVVGEGTLSLSAGNSGVSILANNAGTVSFTGTLAQIDALLTGTSTGTIVYNNGSDTPSASTTISLTVNDGGNTGTDPGLTADGTSEEDSASQTINLTATNDDPTNAGSLPTDVSVTEDVTSNIDLSAVDLSDVDAGASSLTVTLSTSTGGQLTAAAGTGITLGGSATALTFTGTLTDLNNYFNDSTKISYLHGTPNTFGDNADTITVVINDNGNTGTGGGTDQTLGVVNVDITAVNDAPVAATIEGTPVVYTENDGASTITSTITFTDVDDTNIESAVVQISGGYNSGEDVLSFSDQLGITGSYNSTTGTWTLTGSATLADYEAAIRSITYTNTSDNPDTTTRTVSFTVNDGDADSNTVTRDITIAAVNDTPTVSGPGSAYTVNEQTNLSIEGTGFSVTDVDAASGTMTATFVVGEGTIALAAGDSGVTITANNAGTVSFTGTLAQIDALLTGTSTGTIVYNNGSDTPSASTTISLTVNDGGNTGSDPGLTADGSSEEDSASQTINLTATNDDPTNAGSLPTDVSVTEDATSNIDLSAVDFSDVDAGASSLTVTLSTSTGGQLTAAAGTGITLGGSATALTFTGTLTDLNNYFNDSTKISYLHGTPNTFGDNADTITVVINDNGNTGTGGGTDQTLGVVNVDITAVNDAPLVGTNTGTSVAEGGTVTITTAMLNEADVDDSGTGLTYTVTSGPTNGQLELTTNPGVAITSFTQDDVDNNRVVFVHDGTQATTDSFDFSLADGGEDGATPATGTFNFTVTNVNDAPVAATIEGTPVVYTENDGASTITSTITFTDVDDTNIESAVVQISGGYSSSEDVLSFSDQLGITGSYNSTTGTWTLIGSATLADYETAIRSITYTNTSDNPDTTTRTVSFTVNDGDADSNTVTRDIAVIAVNDDPANTGSLPTDVTVTQNVSSDVYLSSINLVDPDDNGGNLTVTLTTSSGGNLSANSGGGVSVVGSGSGTITLTGSLADLNAFLDTASNVQYLHGIPNTIGNDADTIQVVVNDAGNSGSGGGTDQTIGTVNVDIAAINTQAVGPIIDLDSASNFVAENSPAGTQVGITAFADDADAADTVSYSLTDDAGGKFVIDSVTGIVSVLGALDFEAAATETITVRATSTDGSMSTQDFVISIGDVNESPTAQGESFSVNLSGSLSISESALTFNDSDVDGDSLSVMIATAPTNGVLTLDSGGVFVYTPKPGFFGVDTFFYRVTDGTLISDLAEAQITVPAVGLPPTLATIATSESASDPVQDSQLSESAIETDLESNIELDADSNTENTNSDSAGGGDATTGIGDGGGSPTSRNGETQDNARGDQSESGRTGGDGRPPEKLDHDLQLTLLTVYSTAEELISTERSYSPELAQLERLLREDMKQAIIWTQWENFENHDETSMMFYVGSASAGMGIFSIGYVFWALRGGTLMTVFASSLPAWRFIDPIAMLSAYRSARVVGDEELESMIGS